MPSSEPGDAHSVFIIIPVHNRCATTLGCLANLQAQGDLGKYSVVVVDDGSTDGTSTAIQAQYPSVTVLSGSGQLWWTGATAQGMQYAQQQGASHFIWLNDDCLVPSGTLHNLISFVDQHPKAIIGAQGYSVGSQLVFGGKHLHHGYYYLFPCPFGETAPCDMLSGNLVCLPQAVVATIGLPDTILPHYGGDTLYLIRARQAGFNLHVDGRTSPTDMPGESALQPDSWMLQAGGPLKIFQLIFQPQSILNWRVWWVLLTVDHGLLGVWLFGVKYLGLVPKLTIITMLRLLTISIRKKIMALKRRLTA